MSADIVVPNPAFHLVSVEKINMYDILAQTAWIWWNVHFNVCVLNMACEH